MKNEMVIHSHICKTKVKGETIREDELWAFSYDDMIDVIKRHNIQAVRFVDGFNYYTNSIIQHLCEAGVHIEVIVEV